MGISGLLPCLASITRPVHIRDYANMTVAVDAYVWLHRGAYACSLELCQGIPTDRYIAYCMKMVKMLQHNGVKPLLVFDGGNLPIKRDQESTRRERRQDNRKKAIELLRQGNRSGANEYFQKSVDVTPRMAYNLIQVLKQEGIPYIVAPYEADAQMAFLNMNGIVDAIITEDSDLIPYGASRVLFKLDQYGQGKEFRREDLPQLKELDMKGWTSAMIRHMCIMSGCDYLEGLNGFGVKKAHAWIKKYKDDLDRIFQHVRALPNANMPADYEDRFKRADLTFQHQRVFDPLTQTLRPLTDLPPDVDDSEFEFIGPILSREIVIGIATALLDPHSKLHFEIPPGGDNTTNSASQSHKDDRGPKPRHVVAQEALMFQRRRGTGLGLGSAASSPAVAGRTSLTPAKGKQLVLPSSTSKVNKLTAYFQKGFKAPQATGAAAAASQSVPAEDSDEDLDNPVPDESFERMKAAFGYSAPPTRQSTPAPEIRTQQPLSSTAFVPNTPSPPRGLPLHRSFSEPAIRVPVLETPPQETRIVSRFFSSARLVTDATEDGQHFKVISDDLLKRTNKSADEKKDDDNSGDASDLEFFASDDERLKDPVIRELNFNDATLPETDKAATADSAAETQTAELPTAMGSLSSETCSQRSETVSSAAQTQPVEVPSTPAIGSAIKDMLSSQRSTYESRRVSRGPIDSSKAISLDDCDDAAPEATPAEIDDDATDDESPKSARLERPNMQHSITGGLENKENSRTVASNFLAKFAYAGSSPSRSKGSSTSKSPKASSPRTLPAKRKSPEPSQSAKQGSANQASPTQTSLFDRFSAARSRRSMNSNLLPSPSQASRSETPVLIADSDDES